MEERAEGITFAEMSAEELMLWATMAANFEATRLEHLWWDRQRRIYAERWNAEAAKECS